ncbi:MAG: copper resistance CopC family protein [Pseudomonadota bacterium]
MKFLRLLPLLGLVTLAPDVLLAAPELKESFPVNGSVIREAPAQLELLFSEEVKLLKLAVSGIETKMIPTEFKPSTTAQTNFAIPLPGMDEDAYVVAWTILGTDGREVEDKLTFVVDVDAAEKSGSTDASHAVHKE